MTKIVKTQLNKLISSWIRRIYFSKCLINRMEEQNKYLISKKTIMLVFRPIKLKIQIKVIIKKLKMEGQRLIRIKI
jgi:hypothetical protein